MYDAIVLAAGNGLRTGLSTNKVLVKLNGKAVIEYSVQAFLNDPLCEAVYLIHRQEDYEALYDLFHDRIRYVIGGHTREASVYNGLIQVKSPYVLIHDGARPYLPESLLKRITTALKKTDAITPAINIYDTVKKESFGKIIDHIDRDHLIRIQTPQAFKTSIILEAYKDKHHQYTCDATRVMEVLKKDVYTVLGSALNIKFTTIEDLELLELITRDSDWT
jgi:2-C-methyl-D-erythritol 4-phosphate cytidylyltransferase